MRSVRSQRWLVCWRIALLKLVGIGGSPCYEFLLNHDCTKNHTSTLDSFEVLKSGEKSSEVEKELETLA